MFNNSQTQDVYNHPCLDSFAGNFRFPFSRKVREMGEYTMDFGPWTVLGSHTVEPESPDEFSTALVILKYCPFCGARIYPEPEKDEPEPVEPERKKADAKEYIKPRKKSGADVGKSGPDKES